MPVKPNSGVASWGTQVQTPESGPIVSYPRAIVSVKFAYNDGSEANTLMLPSRVVVTKRPHHQAGTCEVEFNATAMPFDLRRLNGIFLTVYMGAAKSMMDSIVDAKYGAKYMVFVGYADSESVQRSPDGTKVTISARDLSSLLRDRKPMYVIDRDGTKIDPTPRYSDTLIGAINRILDWAGYRDVFEIDDRSGLGNTSMGSLTDSRGIDGYIPIPKHDVSAWDAIDHAAGIMSLLVHVDLGKIVIRKPSDAFALPEDPRTPPAYSFVFGKQLNNYINIAELSVTKKFLRNRKGVRLVALTPGGRSVITADYPPDNPPDNKIPPKHAPKLGATKQTKPRKVSLAAGGGVTNSNALKDPARDVMVVGGQGIHSQEGLDRLAETFYRVRSRQELEGTLVTYVWDDKLFGLKNGDRFEIRVKPELETELLNRPDEGSQVAFLKKHFLINDQAAHVMLAQIRGQESSLFYLRSISHEWTTSLAKTTIDFISIFEL